MHGHDGQHPGDGWARLAGAGLLYAEPQTEDPCRSDIKPPRASTARIADASVRKVHLAIDTATGDIRAVEFTSSRESDSPVLPGLLDQIPSDEQVGTVTGDGAFDTGRRHTAILDRGGTAIIPIRRNGRLWKEDCPPPAPATTSFARANASVGPPGSSGPAITPEVHIRVAIMDRFNALGTAEIKRVA